MKYLHIKEMQGNRLLTILLLVCVVSVAWAQDVTLRQAEDIATDFFKSHGVKSATPQKARQRAAARQNGNSPYYIFNNSDESAFVIVSGDSRTEQVLGYSLNGAYDEASMPEDMHQWLDGYEREMEYLNGHPEAAASKVATHSAIKPLTDSQWGQSLPYNGLCPVYNNTTCVTGCTATAMAQIMYYHKCPKDPCKPIPAYITNTLKIPLDALPSTTFKWNDIRPTYEKDVKDNAVATLLRYCGQSVEMDYTPGASAASLQNAMKALHKYFGYDPDARHLSIYDYSISEWDAILYNELMEGRPILYEGYNTNFGHAFVCDGYDGNGFFHFIWGNNGSYDGYYRLSLLNRYDNIEGNTVAQGAVIGIQPDDGIDNSVTRVKGYNMSNTGTVLQTFISTTVDLYFHAGWGVVGDNGTVKKVLATKWSGEVKSGYRINKVMDYDIASANLPRGTYKVVPVAKNNGSNEWYAPVKETNFFIVEVDANGKTVVTLHPIENIAAVDFNYPGNRTVDNSQKIWVTVKNLGEEYNKSLYLFASLTSDKGKHVCVMHAALETGSTGDVQMFFTPKASGIYNIWVATDADGNNVIGQSTVEIRPKPQFDTNITWDNYNREMANGINAHLSIDVTNHSTEDYISPIYFMLWEYPTNNTYIGVGTLNERYILGPGERHTYKCCFEGLKPNTRYILNVKYVKNFSTPSEYVFMKADTFTTGEAPTVKSGDVNGDGKVNIADATMLVGYIVNGQATSNSFVKAAADVNGDGKINIADVTAIIKTIVNQ